ncbi:MAG: thioredoxin domain-containing protein, partial [Planctomycetota bacterium]
LDDYAYLMRGLIDLYQADFDPKWLGYAVKLANQMIALFEDENGGGFYLTGSDAHGLIVRTRPDYDGATPSGNSVAAAELIRLSELTGNKDYFEHAQKVLMLFQDDLKNRGHSLTEMLSAVDLSLGPRSEIVVAGKISSGSTQKVLKGIYGRFLPRTAVLVRDPKTNAIELDKITEMVKAHKMIDGKVTVYLCEDFVCKSPITEHEVFHKAIKELR